MTRGEKGLAMTGGKGSQWQRVGVALVMTKKRPKVKIVPPNEEGKGEFCQQSKKGQKRYILTKDTSTYII